MDVVFERDGETFVVIDTAGVRKRSKMEDAIEFFGRAQHEDDPAADVVVLLFDVTRKMSAIEKNLARYAIDRYKPLILAANKWDSQRPGVREVPRVPRRPAARPVLRPIVFLSAKEGLCTDELIEVANDLFEQGQQRVPTGDLNRVLERALEARQPSAKGYRIRVRYATQRGPAAHLRALRERQEARREGLAALSSEPLPRGAAVPRGRCASCSRTRTPKKTRSQR